MTREQYSRKRRRYIRRKVRLYIRRTVFAAVVALVLFLGVKAVGSLFSRDDANVSVSDEEIGGGEDTGSGEETAESISDSPDGLKNLYSPYVIFVDRDSGEVLAEKNAQDRIYPASLTKIMTAVLAVEYTEKLDKTVVLPKDFFEELYVEGASVAGFEPGERVRLRDLLYGILLPSGAECCIAFAERIAGSEEEFVGMMNRKAEELGMLNTHFCNSTGLQEAEHYSTVEDIAVLLRYALNNEDFRAAFTSRYYATASSEEHPEGMTFYSTMFKHMDNAEIIGGQILGGKTGYTAEAGLCLASLAEMGGKEYILVTAKAAGDHQTEQFHILDAKNAYSQMNVYMVLHSAIPQFRFFLVEQIDE
ncbi:MAG: hypothetical protein NC300_12665 [Bacteroidales bacterium]|nr:D-alanyl-D-alanine carboxypeptidase [Clostridium sp.]MCM1204987.1 hypothetical protein [Bacteroidales bacterium]